jgi:hypothetical protein
MEIHCERLATDLLSFMAAPLLSKARKVESSDNPFDPIGLIRIVRSNENEGGEFTKKDLLNFQKKVKRITPFFETAVSISSLATLGDATIETGKFWQEVIERISTLIRGTGASVFERDETVENENNIRFVCKAATKLFNDKGDEIDEAQIANSKICYEESVDEPAKSFTMWVVKHGRSVVVARTYVQEEFEQYPDLIRKPGRGKFNESPDDISIIMVPVMSIDKKNVDAVIRIAKERKTKDDRFSNEEIKLFMSVIPAISLIFNTARRLELLESLGKRSVNDIKSLYREVVR